MEIIGYGVSRLSVIPVRKDADDRSEQTTQLLFGDDYEVYDKSSDSRWLRIKNHFDGYEGWIDHRQHNAVTREYFEYVSRAEFKITTDLTSTLLYNKNKITILMGSILPISTAELFKMEEQFAFNGESKSIGQKREFEFLKTCLLKYLNAPYQWGGKSPFGIDCSGLVQIAFKICGYRLHRDAHEQALQGRSVPSFSDILPGDVAFFKNIEGRIIHTGIVLESRKIIHASGYVRIDLLDEQGIIDQSQQGYTHHLSHIRRILA